MTVYPRVLESVRNERQGINHPDGSLLLGRDYPCSGDDSATASPGLL